MKLPNHILAITNIFPSPRFPERGVFVLNILKEMHRQGVEVDVIAPLSISSELKRLGRKSFDSNFEGLKVKQPFYVGIPQVFNKFKMTVTYVNNWLFGLSLRFAFNKKKKYDLVYCHFLQSAIPVLESLQIRDTPLLVNIGESNLSDYDNFYGHDSWLNYLNQAAFIVSVSKSNYDYLLKERPYLKKKLAYIPNGVNINLFKPYDKHLAREKLGLNKDEKYVIFCGHLINRKGPLRVLEAIRGTDIKGLFLGSNGPDVPIGVEVEFVGSVDNKMIPYYLSAADVFVLPSLAEGMSNAVLEAMACCTPMVISNLPFNTDYIPYDMAVFIDPNDIKSIREGIFSAMASPQNEKIRNKLLSRRLNISIQTRIIRIFDIMSNKLN